MASISLPSLLFLPGYGKRSSSESFAASALSVTLDDSLGLLVILAVSIAYLSRGYLWGKPDPFHHLWFEKPQADLVGNGIQAKNRNIATKLEETVSNLECQFY